MFTSKRMNTSMIATSSTKIRNSIRYLCILAGCVIFAMICFAILHPYERDFLEKSRMFAIRPPIYWKMSDIRKDQPAKSVQEKTYKIVFWDGVPSWLYQKDIMSTCKYKGCFFSGSRSDSKNSDAVFFHGPDHRGQLPSKQNGQVWIFMSLESPKNTRNFQNFNGKVNRTWSYRRDSDIVTTYGTFRGSNTKTSSDDILLKGKPIAWFVSNCQSKSNRLKYVEILRKHIDVDVYGACGNLKCSRGAEESCRDLLKTTYNFYLSFENSFCRDYVTEKALRRIRDYVVPVVRGGSNYSLFLPPHSYIETSKYPTIEKLSKDLRNIISNQSAYNEFHRWRVFYSTDRDLMSGWCEVCRRLHFQDKHERLYDNFQEWWSGKDVTRFCTDAGDLG